MQIDKKRLIRQLRGCVKWIRNGARGTFEYCTGFGKTFSAMILIRKLLKKNPKRTTTIIVPTIQLKEQWEDEVKSFGLKNVKVYVINTVVIQKNLITTDFLILDEVHRYGSEEFSKVFELIKFRFILGLTATIERPDGNHVLLVSHAPVVDSISLAEARANNWISKYLEFNLGIPFTDEEKKTYDRINKLYNKYFKMFSYDFDLAMKCQAGKAKTPGAVDGPTVRRSYAMVMGWNPVKDASNKQHLWHPDNIAGYAVQFGKFMRMRKEIFYNSQSKVDLAKRIHSQFPDAKMITFSESTSFADRVTEEIPDSVSYHSYIEGKTAEVKQSRKFRTLEGAKNFCNRNKGKLDSLRRRGMTVTWSKKGKQSPSSVRREMLQSFTEGKVRVINTAKALDQGFNVKDIEVAVIFSRTSNPTQQIQRTGRSARKFTFKDGTDKTAIIINVYIKEEQTTQDEKWLRSAQKKSKNVIWTEDLGEISVTYNNGHNASIDGEEPH